MSGAPTRAAVLGAGRLGQAVAGILGAAGVETRLWSRNGASASRVAKKAKGVKAVKTVEAACTDVELVVLAVTAGALREVVAAYGDTARGDHLVLHATRGVEEGFVLPHEIIREETCVRKIGVLGGPLHAGELTSGRALAVVLASRFDEVPAAIRAITDGSPIRVHPSRDVVGVEVAGIISNVTALATGMAGAVGLGETARGVLLTRGLQEASLVGLALGAAPETFAGLAGVGDLIPRKVSSTERHHQVGAAVAEGVPLEEALTQAGGEVEGVVSAEAAVELAAHRGLKLPLVTATHAILHGQAEASAALETVLSLDFDLGRGLGRR